MKTSFYTIYKIELIKLIKRKDWLVLLALAAISILFGGAVITDGYIGESNQSALYWICTQEFNSSVLLITPMIFAFLATRILANEIENGSITLYTNKYRNRANIYLAKSLALTSFSTIIFIALAIIELTIYYTLVVQNIEIASGHFFGENTFGLFLTMIMLFIFSFVTVSQFSLFLSAFFKSTTVIGIVFLTVLVLHNTFKVPILNKLNPWYYVIKCLNDFSTTAKVTINYSETNIILISGILLALIYNVIFNIIGKKISADGFITFLLEND